MNGQGRLGSNRADVNFILVPQDQRDFTPTDFVRVWREEIGPVPGLEALYFEWEVGPSGSSGLTVDLSHPDRKTLEAAASDLAAKLMTYAGVTEIDDGFEAAEASGRQVVVIVEGVPEDFCVGGFGAAENRGTAQRLNVQRDGAGNRGQIVTDVPVSGDVVGAGEDPAIGEIVWQSFEPPIHEGSLLQACKQGSWCSGECSSCCVSVTGATSWAGSWRTVILACR